MYGLKWRQVYFLCLQIPLCDHLIECTYLRDPSTKKTSHTFEIIGDLHREMLFLLKERANDLNFVLMGQQIYSVIEATPRTPSTIDFFVT